MSVNLCKCHFTFMYLIHKFWSDLKVECVCVLFEYHHAIHINMRDQVLDSIEIQSQPFSFHCFLTRILNQEDEKKRTTEKVCCSHCVCKCVCHRGIYTFKIRCAFRVWFSWLSERNYAKITALARDLLILGFILFSHLFNQHIKLSTQFKCLACM